MEDYGRAKQEWLGERLGLELPNGIPTHDTFRRVFAGLCPDAFESCFRRWTQHLHQESGGDLLAIDGKAVRHSFDTASGQGALHLVSVWASQACLVLAQHKVAAKSNEMTAVPLLLEMLDLHGSVVTTDALNTQKNVAAAIHEGGSDYVLALCVGFEAQSSPSLRGRARHLCLVPKPLFRAVLAVQRVGAWSPRGAVWFLSFDPASRVASSGAGLERIAFYRDGGA